MLANKYKSKLGYFLLELDENLESAQRSPKYVIKWENKLEIGDANLEVIQLDKQSEHREIVVSYKSIHVNTYTVFIVNIETGRISYKHDCYQLWERPVFGFLNTFSNDFVILNKYGTSFIPLGNQERRAIYNPDGTERMVHSLRSCDYLKLEPNNILTFERPN